MFSQIKLKGFTLIELLVTMTVLLVLLRLIVPVMNDFYVTYQLKAAAEGIYNDLSLAQAEAKQRRLNIYFVFQTGTNWCYGLNDTTTCSCNTANACQLNGVTRIVNYNNYSGTTLSSDSGSNQLRFEHLRGSIDNPLTLTLSKGGKSISIAINSMGRVVIQ